LETTGAAACREAASSATIERVKVIRFIAVSASHKSCFCQGPHTVRARAAEGFLAKETAQRTAAQPTQGAHQSAEPRKLYCICTATGNPKTFTIIKQDQEIFIMKPNILLILRKISVRTKVYFLK
jgi:hypothetical protein